MSASFTTFWLANYLARNRPALRQEGAKDAPVERELDLHGQIIDECKRRAWKYVHSDPTRPTTCGEGVCDFIIYADKGRMFHMECKSRNGKLSMEQRAFISWVEKLGHRVYVVDNFAAFIELTRN